MDSRTLVEKVMRNLSFQVEAIPIKTNKKILQDRSTSSKPNVPTNVTVKVRKKEINEQYNRGFISNNQSEPEKLLQNIKFVSSHDTIMSFDMLMKEEGENNIPIENKRKPRKHIFDKLKPGICLTTTDDDNQPYMPDKHSTNASQDTWAAWVSKSEQKFRQYETSRKKSERTWLGQKCKPGGCLDPQFGEDTYHYTPVVRDDVVHDPSNTGTVIPDDRLKDGVPSKIKSTDKNKSKNPPISIDHADKAQKSDSVLNIYKNDSKINSIQFHPPDSKDKGITNSIGTKDKPRSSINDSTNAFYSPPKGIKRESNNYVQQDPSNRHSTKDRPTENFPLPIPITTTINSVPAKRDTASKTIDENNPIGEMNNEQINTIPNSNQTEQRLAIPNQVDKEPTGDSTDYIDSSSPIGDNNNISSTPKNNSDYHPNIDKQGFSKDVNDINQKQNVKDRATGKPVENFSLPIPITSTLNSDPANRDTASKAIDDINSIGEMKNEPVEAVPNSYQTEQKLKEHSAIPVQKSTQDNVKYIDSSSLIESNKISPTPKTNNTYPNNDKEGFFEVDDDRYQQQNVKDTGTGILEEKRRNKNQSNTSSERVADQANKGSVIVSKEQNREIEIKNNTYQPSITDQPNAVQNLIENSNNIHNIIQKPHDEPNIVDKIDKVQNITENPTANTMQNINEMPDKVQSIIEYPNKVHNTAEHRETVQNIIENPVKVQNIIEKPNEIQNTTENFGQNVIEKPVEVQNIIENSDEAQNTIENHDAVLNIIEKPDKVQNIIQKPDDVQNIVKELDEVQNNHDGQIPKTPHINSENADLNNKELDITPGKEILSTSQDKSQLENISSETFKPSGDVSTSNMNNHIMDWYDNEKNSNGTNIGHQQTNDSKKIEEYALELPNKQIVNSQDDTAKSDTNKRVDIQGEDVTGQDSGSSIDRTILPVSTNIIETETTVPKSLKVKGDAFAPHDLVPNNLKTVSLELAFHSYLKNNNERIFKTIIDENEVHRCPNDSVTVINSHVKASLQEKYPELIIPIDSSLNMVIKIENNNSQSYTVSDKSKTIPISSYVPSAQISNRPVNRKNVGQQEHYQISQNDRVLDTTLTDIYEHELIPLQKMMRALKADVDVLAGQHSLNKTNVICVNKFPRPKNT